MMKFKIEKNILATATVFFGFASSLISLFFIYENEYSTVFILPLSLAVLSMFFYKIFDELKESIVFNLVILQYLFRYCLLPLLLSSGQSFGHGEHSEYFNIPLTIMVLELFGTFFVFKFFSKKQKKSFLYKTNSIDQLKGSLVLFLLLFLVFFYIYISGALSKINPVWSFSTYLEKNLSGDIEQSSGALGLILFSPFKTVSALLFISIIYRTRKIKESYKKWLYLIVLLVSSLFIVGASRLSLVLFVLPLLFLVRNLIDKKDYKKVLGLTALALIVVITITSILKFSRYGNEIESTDIVKASSLNAYFSGIGNIAIGLEAFDKISYHDMPSYFINDTFQNIPLLSKLTTDEYKLNYRFNNEIYGHSLYADQIVPLSVSGLFHFGFLGVFFYSSIFLSIALYMERLSCRTRFIG